MGLPRTQKTGTILDYRAEDYFFCDSVNELGLEVWTLPMARTLHSGNFDYVLNLPAICSLPEPPGAASAK